MISRLPIIREIKKSSEDARSSALRETLWTVGFSTVPIWFLPLLFSTFTKGEGWKLFVSNIKSGELYLFATALIGPMVCWILADYLIEPTVKSKDDKENLLEDEIIVDKETIRKILNQRFPDALPLIGTLGILAIWAIFAVFLLKTTSSRPWAFELNETALFVGSFIVLLLCSIILFCVLCFKYDLQNPSGRMRDTTYKFVNEFSNFRGSK